VRGDEQSVIQHVIQQPQRLGLQAMNDVLLAPQERMTMQTAVDGTTLLQQQAERYLQFNALVDGEDAEGCLICLKI